MPSQLSGRLVCSATLFARSQTRPCLHAITSRYGVGAVCCRLLRVEATVLPVSSTTSAWMGTGRPRSVELPRPPFWYDGPMGLAVRAGVVPLFLCLSRVFRATRAPPQAQK